MGYLGKRMKELVQTFERNLEIVKRPPTHFWVPKSVVDVKAYLTEQGYDVSGGFKVLPRRWVVERTFAWINRYRRMSKDYEYDCYTSETMLFIAMTRTMLKRLNKQWE